MSSILKRSLSGVIYIAIMFGAVMMQKDVYDLLMILFGVFCFWEYMNITHIKAGYAYILYLIIIFYSFIVPEMLFVNIYIGVSATVNLLLLINLYFKKKLDITQKHIIGFSYVFGGVLALRMLPYNVLDYFDTSFIISIFLMIWGGDTFAYLVGRKWGRKKLFESISPNKTIEGAIGGATGVAIIGCLTYIYNAISFSEMQWSAVVVVVMIFGVYGDLVESSLKRMGNVKDSGTIIPGHGGLLDRLDSLIFVSPFIFILVQIFTYVS